MRDKRTLKDVCGEARRAQDSEVKVVSLLNCQSSTIVLLNFHFPEFIVVPSL